MLTRMKILNRSKVIGQNDGVSCFICLPSFFTLSMPVLVLSSRSVQPLEKGDDSAYHNHEVALSKVPRRTSLELHNGYSQKTTYHGRVS